MISCPLDAVDVFDGLDAKAPLIGRYCGQQRNVVIFSTEHHLLVTFTTLKRTADSQNRGFLAKFEFSETFVKLGIYFEGDLSSLFYISNIFHFVCVN